MGPWRWVVVSAVLGIGCVDRQVESPLVGLGDAGTPGKESSPGVDSTDPIDETETAGDSGTDTEGNGPKGDPESPSSDDSSTTDDEEATWGVPEDPTSGGEEPSTDDTSGADVPGAPMWSDCASDNDCDDDICLQLQANGELVDTACSSECNDPVVDCVTPTSGTAQPSCLTADQGINVCVLLCDASVACPDGMLCYQVNPATNFNLCF